MKIGPGEKFFLLAASVIFDIVNIFFAVTIILNTVINIFFGLFFIAWFKQKANAEEEDENSTELKAIQENTDRLKSEYKRLKQEYQKRQLAKQEAARETSVGQEIGPNQGERALKEGEEVVAKTTEHETAQTGERLASEGEGLATKEAEELGARTAEHEATQTSERLAAQVGEKVAVRETEQITEKVAAKATSGLVGRILGRTFVAKIIPFLNDLPLWTISTVLLLRGNQREQVEQEEAIEAELQDARAENSEYRRAIREMTST